VKSDLFAPTPWQIIIAGDLVPGCAGATSQPFKATPSSDVTRHPHNPNDNPTADREGYFGGWVLAYTRMNESARMRNVMPIRMFMAVFII